MAPNKRKSAVATRSTRSAKNEKAATKPDPEDYVDYQSMKLAELKKACETKGLDSKGKKADLVQRLQQELVNNLQSE
jgi:hypothetical protein